MLLYHLNFPSAFGGDGSGKGALRVRDGRIAEVIPRLERLPEGEAGFDCGGRTLTPGLDDRGALKPGLRADLALWERDPSVDIMALAGPPAAVWLDGEPAGGTLFAK